MAARQNIPQEALDYYKSLRDASVERGLTADRRGDLMLERYPNLFSRHSLGTSIDTKCARELKATGVDVPSLAGGRPQVPSPHKATKLQIPELIFDFEPKIICISDVHSPVYSRRLVRRALDVIERRGITCAVVNGDFFDNAYKGHYGRRNVRSAPFEKGLAYGAELLALFEDAGIRRFVVLQGNHDDKPLRGSDQELTYNEWWAAMVEPMLDDSAAQWDITHRYYAIMRAQSPKAWDDDGFGPENYPWRFTHQHNYGKGQLSVAQELASIYEANIVTGHQHHLATGFHKSGHRFICDAGTFADPELSEYKVIRDSRFPAWGCGFLTIEHGTPMTWRMQSNDAWWEEQLGG